MGDKALTDHPSRKELLAVVRGDLTTERTKAILLHLFQGCKKCLDAAPSALKFGFGLEGKTTAEEEAAIDAAIQRVFKVAARHDQHLRRQDLEAKKAEKILAEGGAPADFPLKMGTLAKYKALLARSWSLRHEDTGAMVCFARLAVQSAEQFESQVVWTGAGVRLPVSRPGRVGERASRFGSARQGGRRFSPSTATLRAWNLR